MQEPIHMQFSTIRDLCSAIQQKQTSVEEVYRSAQQFAQQQNPKINCFIDLNTSAPSCDTDPAASLLGVPIAHKDVFVTKEGTTTAGSKMLANYRSPFDATIVQRLHQSGCMSLGKLNCDEFAMGSSNETSFFGAVHNPWNPLKTAGGSSGGSAAAVAAGLVMVATGSDTGGSIRQPAAFCGVSGIKPTYGTTSRFGMIAYASSLDQAGVFARNAQDLADTLDSMIGYDPQDSTMVEQSKQYHSHYLKNEFDRQVATFLKDVLPLKGIRIGLPKQYFETKIDENITSAIRAALSLLESLGASLISIDLPLTEMSIPAYYVIASAEASSNLSRFDSVRYGHRAQEYKDFADMVAQSRSEAFGEEVQRRILVGTYVLSHGFYDAYYLQAQKVRRLVAQDFVNALQNTCDVIMGPVSPSVAWDLGALYQDPIAMYNADIFTLGPSLAGLPTLSVPCGLHSDRLPIGLQMIGNHFQEARILALAHIYQLHTEWHQQRPSFL